MLPFDNLLLNVIRIFLDVDTIYFVVSVRTTVSGPDRGWIDDFE